MPRAEILADDARKSLCPSLPPEVWINILSYHSDLAHLWNTVRRVSPTLRACAERAFGDNFLKDVHIEFLLERHNLGGKRGPHEPAISVEFERLGKGDEEKIAWFRGHMIIVPWLKEKTPNMIMQRWHENIKKRKPELPNYTICIGDMVNDTHIPSLTVNVEEYEVQLDWRGMLQLFFREHAKLDASKAEWQRAHQSSHQTTATRIAKGSKLVSMESPAAWQGIEAECRRNLRRMRLKEHYRDNAEVLWAIDSLKYFERADSSKWSSASPKMLPHLPGSGLGERWFGSTNLVQELYLDECSSMNRIDTQIRLVSKLKTADYFG
ncbi:hypothetical protein M3J09_010471 [Ascochyta lentis]